MRGLCLCCRAIWSFPRQSLQITDHDLNSSSSFHFTLAILADLPGLEKILCPLIHVADNCRTVRCGGHVSAEIGEPPVVHNSYLVVVPSHCLVVLVHGEVADLTDGEVHRVTWGVILHVGKRSFRVGLRCFVAG